eukprot:TRINITY_DN2822_c0_g1_i1.p1 TRINITY_DN2822_c0_g1~~TRINITY_DN2822_c0_g1_i1.p1  ORF type:complete len:183 (+),score=45.44 TRINITY_DN2822_c0_g1_i1:97-645(+)
MGGFFSRLFGSLLGSKKYRILILGLDNAGKTTILRRLQLGEVVKTSPTVGFNVETVQHRNVNLEVWDLGGQTSIRPYWRCYFQQTDGIVYVVDSTDSKRLSMSKKELMSLLGEEELYGVPLIVFANKSDLSTALPAGEIGKTMGLSSIRDREWKLQRSSAFTGEGLDDGMKWLTDCLRNGKN